MGGVEGVAYRENSSPASTTGHYSEEIGRGSEAMETTIRSFTTGDDAARVGIFNEAAAGLPKFKPATLDEIRRRTHGRDFDPADAVLRRGQRAAAGIRYVSDQRARFASPGAARAANASPNRCSSASSGDEDSWSQAHLRRLSRRLDGQTTSSWPMASATRTTWSTSYWTWPTCRRLRPATAPGISAADARMTYPPWLPLCRTRWALPIWRPWNATSCTTRTFHPMPPSSLRGKTEGQLAAAGILIVNPAYADPTQVDCGHAVFPARGVRHRRNDDEAHQWPVQFPDAGRPRCQPARPRPARLCLADAGDTDVSTVAAQVSSAVPHLLRFYERYFRKQGSFPIFEREL